jgi:hypothetical protein
MRPIEIERTNEPAGERAWRAIVRIPKGIELTGYGICGARTETGAWADGYGRAPEFALREAYIVIGKAVASMHPPIVETVSMPIASD